MIPPSYKFNGILYNLQVNSELFTNEYLKLVSICKEWESTTNFLITNTDTNSIDIINSIRDINIKTSFNLNDSEIFIKLLSADYESGIDLSNKFLDTLLKIQMLIDPLVLNALEGRFFYGMCEILNKNIKHVCDKKEAEKVHDKYPWIWLFILIQQIISDVPNKK